MANKNKPKAKAADLSLDPVAMMNKWDSPFSLLSMSMEVDEQMQEDTMKRSNTPFYPWFRDHVRRSAKRSFTPEYFTMGLMDEVGKYKEERLRADGWPPQGKQLDEVVSRAGNVYWYIYGLCSALEEVAPETVEDDGYDLNQADFRKVLGPLCGAVREWAHGDQDRAVLWPQVQASVSRLLRHMARGSVMPTEEVMRLNIAKIKSNNSDSQKKGNSTGNFLKKGFLLKKEEQTNMTRTNSNGEKKKKSDEEYCVPGKSTVKIGEKIITISGDCEELVGTASNFLDGYFNVTPLREEDSGEAALLHSIIQDMPRPEVGCEDGDGEGSRNTVATTRGGHVAQHS